MAEIVRLIEDEMMQGHVVVTPDYILFCDLIQDLFIQDQIFPRWCIPRWCIRP